MIHSASLFRLFLALLAGVSASPVLAQTGIGDWKSYLSHTTTVDVAVRGQEVFAASDVGFFYRDFATGDSSFFSSLSGLGAREPSTVFYDSSTNYVVLGFKDGTVNYFQQPGTFKAFFDIAVSDNFIDKTINCVAGYQGRIYLGTDFGIVVFDPQTGETLASILQITLQNSNPTVNTLTVFEDTLYAGLNNGLFKAPLLGSNLAAPSTWQAADSSGGLPLAQCRSLAHNGEVLAAIIDTAVYFKAAGGSWEPPDTALPALRGPNLNSLSFAGFRDPLTLATENQSYRITPSTTLPLGNFQSETHIIAPADGRTLGVNRFNELYYTLNNGRLIFPLRDREPNSNVMFDLDAHADHLAVSTRPHSTQFQPTFFFDKGAWELKPSTREWTAYHPGIRGVPDSNFVRNPADLIYSLGRVEYVPETDELFTGSWDHGLFHFREDTLVNWFNGSNSSLCGAIFDGQRNLNTFIRITGMEVDEQGKLWATTFRPEQGCGLSVRDSTGQWRSFNTPTAEPLDLLIDANGFKWMPDLRGLLVYDDNRTPLDPSDDRSRVLRQSAGQGNLNANQANCVAMDQDQTIWVGTAEGVTVFFNPFSVFDGGTAADASCPIFEGFCLLRNQNISAIAVDGANRKWIGTSQAGAFLVSPDGTEQVLTFNESNSPLISNRINDIAIDPESGEVFFATDRGLVSFQGNAIAGRENNDSLFVFPNPADPSRQGDIIIRGTVRNATATIISPSGLIVRRLESNGGQVVWDGRDFEGKRVANGMYLVQITDPEGERTGTTQVAILARE